MSDIVFEMITHAESDPGREVCGLIVTMGKKTRILQGVNTADEPQHHFVMDPKVWMDVPAGEKAVGLYHSHVYGGTEPSMHDLRMCEATGMPWHIVSIEPKDHRIVNPSGYVTPYVGRPYVHGVLDCYTIVQDYYVREFGIELPDFDRQAEWWERGLDLYRDNFVSAGFTRVPVGTPLEVGDCFLIQCGGRVAEHAAIYVGDDKILHHVFRRLSGFDPYGGVWKLKTTHHLRHNSKINKNG